MYLAHDFSLIMWLAFELQIVIFNFHFSVFFTLFDAIFTYTVLSNPFCGTCLIADNNGNTFCLISAAFQVIVHFNNIFHRVLQFSCLFEFKFIVFRTRHYGGATDRSEKVERTTIGQDEGTDVQRDKFDPRVVTVFENRPKEVHKFAGSVREYQWSTVGYVDDDTTDQVDVCSGNAGRT